MTTQMTSQFTATTAFEKLKDVTGHHTKHIPQSCVIYLQKNVNQKTKKLNKQTKML